MGAADIACALKENRSLEDVNLSYCGINDAAVNEIALALQENKETALMYDRLVVATTSQTPGLKGLFKL